MPLESLLQLVETLRSRIETHRTALSQSEALTRYALIDPLLRELGWDISDPSMVVPEYRSGSGRADYALLASGRPAMMVEAKKLGQNLHDTARSQGIQYCIEEGTRYFSVTDGGHWEIYETHRPVPIDQKRIVEFDLTGTSAAGICLKALALWRPSVQSGTVVAGQEPVVTRSDETGASPPPDPIVPPAVENGEWLPVPDLPPEIEAKPPPIVHDAGWVSIIHVTPKSRDRAPLAIMFPNQTSVTIDSWKSMLVGVARWLIKSNILTTSHCPIPYSNRSHKRYVVSTDAFHSDGSPFSEPEREQVGPFHIDTKHAASQIVTPTQSIITHVGQDPAQFKVRFS